MERTTGLFPMFSSFLVCSVEECEATGFTVIFLREVGASLCSNPVLRVDNPSSLNSVYGELEGQIIG